MENVISLEQFKSDKEKEIAVVNIPLTAEDLIEQAVDITVIIEEITKLLEEGHDIAVEYPMGIRPLAYILMKIDPDIRYVTTEEIITRKLKSLILLKPVYKEESKSVMLSDSIRLNNSFIKSLIADGKGKLDEEGLLIVDDKIDYGL